MYQVKCNELDEVSVIQATDAVVEPVTVMVELTDAFVAAGAMLRARAYGRIADLAFELENSWVQSEVVDLFLDFGVVMDYRVFAREFSPLSDHWVGWIGDLPEVGVVDNKKCQDYINDDY